MITKTTPEALEKFTNNFKRRCMRSKDYLIYPFTGVHYAVSQCAQANFIIQKLDLPLVAIHSGNNDYFIVQGLNSDL